MSTLQLLLEYVKVLAWPLLITGVLIAYRPPLRRLFLSFVVKFEKAASVTFGSFSMAVQQQARDLGIPELGQEIGKLSVNAIEALVRAPRTDFLTLASFNDLVSPHEYGIPKSSELDGLRELAAKKLITFTKPPDHFVRLLTKNGQPMEEDTNKRSPAYVWYASDLPELDEESTKVSYKLTEAGLKAVEAITKAVAEQLSQSAS